MKYVLLFAFLLSCSLTAVAGSTSFDGIDTIFGSYPPAPENYLDPNAKMCQRKPGDPVGHHVTSGEFVVCGEYFVIDNEFLEYHGLKEKYPELEKPMKLLVSVDTKRRLIGRNVNGEPVFRELGLLLEKFNETGFLEATPYMDAVRKSMGMPEKKRFYPKDPDFAQSLCLAAEEQRIYCWPYAEVDGPAIMSPRYSGFRNKYVPKTTNKAGQSAGKPDQGFSLEDYDHPEGSEPDQ